MVASSFPSLLVVTGGCFFMYESPRFLLARGYHEQSFFILDRYLELNGVDQPLTEM